MSVHKLNPYLKYILIFCLGYQALHYFFNNKPLTAMVYIGMYWVILKVYDIILDYNEGRKNKENDLELKRSKI
jgi:hypothetical protein